MNESLYMSEGKLIKMLNWGKRPASRHWRAVEALVGHPQELDVCSTVLFTRYFITQGSS